jgi:integrase
VHSYARAAKHLPRWSAREGEQVTAKAQRPRLGRRILDVLSRDEIRAMEERADTERDKLIVRILGDTGIRLGGLPPSFVPYSSKEGGRCRRRPRAVGGAR